MLAQPPPPPFFQEEMDSRRIKTRVAGNIKVGCKTNTATATATELHHQVGGTRLAKEKIVLRAPNALAAESVSVLEDVGKKISRDAASAFIATSAWPAGMTKIGKYFKLTSK